MVSSEEFERLRAVVSASGPASSGDNLLGMEIDACAYLGDPAYADDDPELWQGMRVQRSEGSEWLINGRASGKSEDASSIAEALSRIWEQKLRYNYESAHTVRVATESVTLLAVTQSGPGDIWVTARIEVALS
ncbi:MAG: hypothetical protein IPL41_00630 [Micropruina sp.]|nr:hypothetical protein [Micropruina sp.]